MRIQGQRNWEDPGSEKLGGSRVGEIGRIQGQRNWEDPGLEKLGGSRVGEIGRIQGQRNWEDPGSEKLGGSRSEKLGGSRVGEFGRIQARRIWEDPGSENLGGSRGASNTLGFHAVGIAAVQPTLADTRQTDLSAAGEGCVSQKSSSQTPGGMGMTA